MIINVEWIEILHNADEKARHRRKANAAVPTALLRATRESPPAAPEAPEAAVEEVEEEVEEAEEADSI